MVAVTAEQGGNKEREREWYIQPVNWQGQCFNRRENDRCKGRAPWYVCLFKWSQLACPFPSWWMHNRESSGRRGRQKWCMGLETRGENKQKMATEDNIVCFYLLCIKIPTQINSWKKHQNSQKLEGFNLEILHICVNKVPWFMSEMASSELFVSASVS